MLVISSNFDYELLGVSQKWKDFLRKPIGEKKFITLLYAPNLHTLPKFTVVTFLLN